LEKKRGKCDRVSALIAYGPASRR